MQAAKQWGRGEEMERSTFGIKLESQEEKVVDKLFLVFSAEVEVLLEGLRYVTMALWLVIF